MKKFILKSLVIFIMVLTLGLILIPIVPTEKEVIESDFSFDLIFDVIVDEEYYNDNFDFLNYDYNFYFYQFVNEFENIESLLFNVYNAGSFNGPNVYVDILNNELEIRATGYFRLWGVSK